MKPLKKRCEVATVLQLLAKDYTRQKIIKKLNINATALSNHLRRLENSGYIERKGKFVIKVLRSSYLNPMVSKNKLHKKLNKRGHGHNVSIYFSNEENLLNKRKVKQELKSKVLEKLPFGSLRLVKDRYTIWINKKSITVYSNNSYYSGNALHSKFRALKDLDKLADYLKGRYNFKGHYGIEVFREHYGLIFNKFAQWIIKQNKKLYVKDKRNKTIFWVDKSRKDDIGLEEFESEDPVKINTADHFFNSKEKTGWKDDTPQVAQNTKDIEDQKQIVGKSMKVLEGYAEQIALHLRVEQKQEKHLDDQTQLFREIRDLLKAHTKGKHL